MARAPRSHAHRHGQAACLVSTWLAGLNPLTRIAFASDVDAFSRWAGLPPDLAISGLLRRGRGRANQDAAAWMATMCAGGSSPATVQRRLAGLRSLLRAARLYGVIDWAVDVRSPRVETRRDTRGPGRDRLEAALAQLRAATGWRARRTQALLRLLHDLALRVSEALGLDLEHLELERGAVWVLRKRTTARRLMSLPPETVDALGAWLAERGDRAGPLFPSARGDPPRRLSLRAVQSLTRRLGLGNPHGLRHLAITEALDRTNGDIRAVQRFSGHVDVNNVLRYDDARRDVAGAVARMVAGPPPSP